MRCPRQQLEVVNLVDQMINGITENPEKFPSCNASVLQADRQQFEQITAALNDAQAQVAIIAAQKLDIFKKMHKNMKCQIKLGVVDNVNSPENLSLIGWGTKRLPTTLEIPGQPGNLKITAQGEGLLCLIWDKSKNGGPIRSFIIERKQFNGNWSEWQFAGTSYNSDAKLTKQPIGIKLEYQVRAGNASGQSWPTNTVAVVL